MSRCGSNENLDFSGAGIDSASRDAMTTANKITIFRILLVPLFAYEILSFRESGIQMERWLALAAFATAAILDGVDGFIARHYHQKSELGAVLDPAADKLLLAAGVVLLSLEHPHLNRLPLWLILAIISRDTILLLGLIIVHITVGRCVVRPRWTGKVATVLQMTVVLWALLKLPVNLQTYIAGGAAILTVISGIQYLYDGGRQLSASPRSAATPGQ